MDKFVGRGRAGGGGSGRGKGGAPPGKPKLKDPTSCLMVYYEESIDGLGLKAMKHIGAGTQVLEYTGVVMSLEQFANDPERTEHEKYAIITPRFCISALKAGNLARFVNHSCQDWNLRIEIAQGGLPILLVATKDIQPGDILTFDYGSWNQSPFECKCKSKEHTR